MVALPSNVRVASWLAAQCLKQFMVCHELQDKRLTALCKYLAELVETHDILEWDARGHKLHVTGLGDPLPEGLDTVENLAELVECVREVSASQLFGAYEPDEVRRYLGTAIRISNLDTSRFNMQALNSVPHGPEGFGGPLSAQQVSDFWVHTA